MATLKTVQKLGLQQKLSPQMIQAQLLLAIPTVALEDEIKKQIEDNPMLEDSTEEIKDVQPEAQLSQPADENAQTPGNSETEVSSNSEADSDEDWYNYTGQNESYKPAREYNREEYDSRTDYLINKGNKLKESPLDQLYEAGLDENDTVIGEEIIGSLSSDGYLKENLEDILEDLHRKYFPEISMEDVERVLKLIQKFDPVGIASRNLKECLSVQLEELALDEETKSLSLKLINQYFDEFKSKHFEKISKLMGISMEKVNELFDVIHRLNPVPGNTDTAIERDYIYPDFIVTKTGDELNIELTEGSVPPVRISKRYVELLKAKNTSKQTKEFLKKRFDSAKWFIDAIKSRRETMLNVMKAIAVRQRDFFISGKDNLKPMFEKDIAEDIGMDISTISRTVRSKYVQTDFGTFELKYFFSNSIHNDIGEDVSTKIVKEKLRDLIEQEDKSKPLSDDRLTSLMNNSGLNIARRTVAKYREAMKIPKATLRRKILL